MTRSYGDSPGEVNKFKFQIRNRLKKENVLYIISKQGQFQDFVKTLQLSEKLEPQSFQEFLKSISFLGDKAASKMYASKMQLKSSETRAKTLQKNIQNALNCYMLEHWKEINQKETELDLEFSEYLAEVLEILSQDREDSVVISEFEELQKFQVIKGKFLENIIINGPKFL